MPDVGKTSQLRQHHSQLCSSPVSSCEKTSLGRSCLLETYIKQSIMNHLVNYSLKSHLSVHNKNKWDTCVCHVDFLNLLSWCGLTDTVNKDTTDLIFCSSCFRETQKGLCEAATQLRVCERPQYKKRQSGKKHSIWVHKRVLEVHLFSSCLQQWMGMSELLHWTKFTDVLDVVSSFYPIIISSQLPKLQNCTLLNFFNEQWTFHYCIL